MADTEASRAVASAWPSWRVIGGIAVGLALLAALFLAMTPKATEMQAPKGVAMLGRQVDDVVLRDIRGEARAWGDLKGVPRAVFFGFTSCPEICPTTIADLAASIDRLGPRARAIRVDFVTVDPGRDTPAVLARYLDSFGPQFAGYVGAEDQVLKLATAFRAAYRRTPVESGGYTMDHTTTVYLVDPGGVVRDVVAYQTPPAQLDAQLDAFLGR